jgi:hypothetical protein
MKTKEEIVKHLKSVPYNKSSRNRIIGFLLGKGIIEKGEVMNFTECPVGESFRTFDEFYGWFESDECPLCGLLRFLCAAQEVALADGDEFLADEMGKYIWFLVEHFGLEVSEAEKCDEE